MRLFLFFTFLLGTAGGQQAWAPQDVPPPEAGWVTDLTGRLGTATLSDINSAISAVKNDLGYEIGLAVVWKMPPGWSIADYTRTVFNTWGIGQKGVNNGVLMLLALGDRVMRIQTAAGSKEVLTDWKCSTIIEEMKDKLRAGDHAGACRLGIDLITQVLRGEDNLALKAAFGWVSLVVFCALLGLGVWYHSRDKQRKQKRRQLFEQRLKHLRSAQFARRLEARQETCAICLDNLAPTTLDKKDDDGVTNCIQLRCGHPFHTECIREWLAKKNICPLCRKPDPTAPPGTTEAHSPASGSSGVFGHDDAPALYKLQLVLFEDIVSDYDLHNNGWNNEYYDVGFSRRAPAPSTTDAHDYDFGGGDCGADGSW